MAADWLDPVVLDMWHPIAATVELVPDVQYQTRLLGESISYSAGSDGSYQAIRAAGDPMPVREDFGVLWTSLGCPPKELFDFPEFHEPDRQNVWAGSVGVHTSAPRAVENFLDMGHFPYVHTGYLGAEPHTEVKDYNVEIVNNGREVLATGCEFFQPMGALNALGGMLMEYVYRVPHPYCSILYKSSPIDDQRRDAIVVFCQAVDEENTRAHLVLSLLDDQSDERMIKAFQQLIFGQDKPILENQHPKRLPLDPSVETPIRSDKTSIAYRRWLLDLGIRYGVLVDEVEQQ